MDATLESEHLLLCEEEGAAQGPVCGKANHMSQELPSKKILS